MAKIKEIHSREILNSQGNPTIETVVILNDGNMGVSSVPSMDSDNKYSTVNLIDHDQNRFLGMGVQKAVENVLSIIAPKIIGYDAHKQQEIDKILIELDGTQNKGRLGANTTFSVSCAIAKAAAKSSMLPMYLYLRQFIKHENIPHTMPTAIFSLINGGRHAGNFLDFKDFLLVPASFKTFEESLQMAYTIQKGVYTTMVSKNLPPLYSIEGGYAPALTNNSDAFSLLSDTLEACNFRLGYDAFFGLDANSDAFYNDKKYKIKDRQTQLSSSELLSYYVEIINKYHILYMEDPLGGDDWEGWEKMEREISEETTIVGDVLTASNPYRLQMALDKKAISGMVIKPIQAGTVIEALAVLEVARTSGIKIVISHQRGDTIDDFIADFAVAVSADYVNFGPLTRGEYIVKYNRLNDIEKQLKIL